MSNFILTSLSIIPYFKMQELQEKTMESESLTIAFQYSNMIMYLCTYLLHAIIESLTIHKQYLTSFLFSRYIGWQLYWESWQVQMSNLRLGNCETRTKILKGEVVEKQEEKRINNNNKIGKKRTQREEVVDVGKRQYRLKCFYSFSITLHDTFTLVGTRRVTRRFSSKKIVRLAEGFGHRIAPHNVRFFRFNWRRSSSS